jgi:hypothetical protein
MRLTRKSSFHVPCGDFTLESDGVLGWGATHAVVGAVFDGGEFGGGMTDADAALVVAESHVHDPVQAVLDGPMLSNDCGEQVCVVDLGCDVEAGFGLDFGADLSAAFDDDDGLEPWPVVAFLEPVDIVDDGGFGGFRCDRDPRPRSGRG